MPRESVGDALRKVHGLLRPSGLLVNMQPYARPMEVEVRFGADRRTAGVAHDSDAKLEDMRASWRTVADLTAAGLFALRGESTCAYEFHFPGSKEWQEFVEKPNPIAIEAKSALLKEALACPDGLIVVTEENLGRLYERLAPPGGGSSRGHQTGKDTCT